MYADPHLKYSIKINFAGSYEPYVFNILFK